MLEQAEFFLSSTVQLLYTGEFMCKQNGTSLSQNQDQIGQNKTTETKASSPPISALTIVKRGR